jgi:hypothetical protein
MFKDYVQWQTTCISGPEFLLGKLDSYKWAMKLVLGYECRHYLHSLQQHNHVILAQVSLSNPPLAVAAHRQM